MEMATRAMQHKDNDALTLGVVALLLANDRDGRDLWVLIARLAFAAKECGLELADYAMLVCPEVSPKIMQLLRNPVPVTVAPNAKGDLVFQRTAAGEANRARYNELRNARARRGRS